MMIDLRLLLKVLLSSNIIDDYVWGQGEYN